MNYPGQQHVTVGQLELASQRTPADVVLVGLELPLVYKGKTYILAKAGDVRGIISPKGSRKCA